MNICLAHNLYGKYSHGGAETAVNLMIADFKKSGQEVFLITTRPTPKINSTDKENLIVTRTGGVEIDLKIYYLNSKFYNLADLNIIARFFWQFCNLISFRKYRAIKNILKKEKPDLVITHNLMGLGFLMPWAIKKLKIRHEHFLHDIQLLHPSGLMIYGHENILNSCGAKIYQNLTRLLLASPAKIISPSKWLLDLHLKKGFFKKSETEVRPFQWKAIKKINNSKSKSKFKRFLFVGQIEKQKGIIFLINTFKKIRTAELSLTIASRNGGQKLNEVRDLIKDDIRIKLLCPLSFTTTQKLIETSDCLIVPSLCYENSPTIIYGAHAAGRPIIASNIGGIPEICQQNDLLFEPGNEADLISKINSF